MSTRWFSVSVSRFLPWNDVHHYHFSRFHIHELIYKICFSFSDLLHSVWQTLGPSTSLQMTQFSFLVYGWVIVNCISQGFLRSCSQVIILKFSLNKNFHFFLRLIDFHWQTYSSKREKKDVLDRLRGELRAGELKAHWLIGFHRTNLWVSTSGKFNDIQWVFLPETEGRDPADAVEYSCLENMRDLLHWGSRNQKMTVAEI